MASAVKFKTCGEGGAEALFGSRRDLCVLSAASRLVVGGEQ
jgi:hypothetical protein